MSMQITMWSEVYFKNILKIEMTRYYQTNCQTKAVNNLFVEYSTSFETELNNVLNSFLLHLALGYIFYLILC